MEIVQNKLRVSETRGEMDGIVSDWNDDCTVLANPSRIKSVDHLR